VFDPHKVKMNLEKENPLDEEFTDGIYLWNMKTPKWLKEKDHEN